MICIYNYEDNYDGDNHKYHDDHDGDDEGDDESNENNDRDYGDDGNKYYYCLYTFIEQSTIIHRTLYTTIIL